MRTSLLFRTPDQAAYERRASVHLSYHISQAYTCCRRCCYNLVSIHHRQSMASRERTRPSLEYPVQGKVFLGMRVNAPYPPFPPCVF